MAEPKTSIFTPEDVAEHIRRKHPRCPSELKIEFIEAISAHHWDPPVSLGKAFGIVATNRLRHGHTDYEELMRTHGLLREEARLVVQAEIRDTLAAWKKKRKKSTGGTPAATARALQRVASDDGPITIVKVILKAWRRPPR